MFYLVFLRWIFYWLDHIFKPLLKSPYLYVVLGSWILLSIIMTILFLYYIDSSRLRYIYKSVLTALVKSGLTAILVSTMLFALFKLALKYAGESDLFYHQRHVSTGLFLFGNEMFTKFIALSFLVGTTILSIRSVSEIAYQLQDNKKWWFYTGLMTIVALVCYGAYMLLGYV